MKNLILIQYFSSLFKTYEVVITSFVLCPIVLKNVTLLDPLKLPVTGFPASAVNVMAPVLEFILLTLAVSDIRFVPLVLALIPMDTFTVSDAVVRVICDPAPEADPDTVFVKLHLANSSYLSPVPFV